MAKELKKSAAKKAAKNVATKKVAAKKAPVKKAAAKKAVAPAQKAPAKKAPAAAKTTPAKKAAVKKAAPKKAVSKKTAPKKAAKKLTTVVAKIDVGFGSSLSIRGEGADLSWEKGILMGCAESDEWVWSSESVKGTLEFKVLINDEIWALGANEFVDAGKRIVIEPIF